MRLLGEIMVNVGLSDVLHQVRTLFGVGVVAGLSDAQLLERFLNQSASAGEATLAAEAAFEALVARHGPMVLGVCRRALDDPNEVDDAFQATFLVLVRRAGSVRADDSLGRWLYGVARRVAAKAKSRSDRSRGRTAPLADEPAAPDSAADRVGLLAALDEEVSRLPAKYRDPIVLCHLNGLSHAEAAARLRWPVGTVSGRLSRARGLLRDRLVRRGMAPTSGAMVILLVTGQARAAVPASLTATTVRAAARLLMGGTAASAGASASTLSLMNEVLRAAAVVRMTAAATVLALTLAGFMVVKAGVPAGASAQSGDQDSRRALAVASAPGQGHSVVHRPADEIVKELDESLKAARRRLSEGEWNPTHIKIATLVDELRTAYPDDSRGARYLPKKWESLLVTPRFAEVPSEVREVLETSADPVLRNDALFLETTIRFMNPIDGPAAVSLAEAFARQAPDDNRSGELLYSAATKLDYSWYTLAGLAVTFALAAALTAATAIPRVGLKIAVRKWKLAVLLGGLAVVPLVVLFCGFLTLSNDKLIAIIVFMQNHFESPSLRYWIQSVLEFATYLLVVASQQLGIAVRTGRAGLALALALAAVAGYLLVVVRGRLVGTPMRRRACVRTGIFGLVAVLGVACAVDACLIARQRNAVVQRVVREYPDSFRGRLIQGERRQREQLGKPFDLDFADAMTGRPVSMRTLRGKVVVVNFWASWDGECGREIDEMTKLYNQYHDKGVEFIGVSLDLPEEDGGLGALKAFVADRKIRWPQYYQSHDRFRSKTGSPTNDFSESWGIDRLPTVFLVDAEGKLYSTEVRGKLERSITSSGKLERLITRLLKRSRASASGR